MKRLIVSSIVSACACLAFAENPVTAQPPKPESAQTAVERSVRPVRPLPPGAGLHPGRRLPQMMRFAGRDFGTLSDGRRTKLYTLQGEGGLRLDVTDYGGRVVRVYAPDRYGNLADVTLGWNTAAEYEKNGFSMGTLIGRFGNRIKDGKFKLNGTEYTLPVNEDKPPRHNHIHGGPKGWDAQIWEVRPVRRGLARALELTYVSADGEMGYPGKVTCKVVYAVHPNNVWTIEYEATTDKPTVLNLTHHSYWNLAGEASGNVLKQQLQVFADEYTETDAGLIPTKNVPVKGTGFDFTQLRTIDAMAEWMAKTEHLKAMDNWYDHNFVLRGKAGELKQAATMKDPVSGRKLEIWTTEPCMQMYGAQNMDGTMAAKEAGKKLVQFAGVALETQHCPDSPNHPEFPTTVLNPGETFRSRTEYRFSAE